ncbi:MAG: DUF2818 family protein [Pseudomonadota bacterium]
MNTSLAVWINLILAGALANLPFARALGRRLYAPPAPLPAHWLDTFAWLLCYGMWMGIATLLQTSSGSAPPMGWEIRVVTLALFAVLAFPGLAWRYLLPHKPQARNNAHGQ